MLDDNEITKRVAKFDISILEEASYILWHIWKERYRGYETLQACITALSVNDSLYESLKRAHACRKYDAIRNWSASSEYYCCYSPDHSQTPVQNRVF